MGREDKGLTARLLTELPSILNWAIVGWTRLQARGYFEQPESAKEAMQELEDLSSPVSAFVRERCEVGPDRSVEVNELYRQWKAWCEESGRTHPGNLQGFGRDLRAVVPAIRIARPRTGVEDQRIRQYAGIGLKHGFGPRGPRT